MSSIEGIEIDLFNGQKALIYPKYAQKRMLDLEQMRKWGAKTEVEIEALKVEETNEKTVELLKIESPAAKWVSHFWHDKYGIFCLPSLLAVLEIQHQKKEINALAETIEGADLLEDAGFASSDISISVTEKDKDNLSNVLSARANKEKRKSLYNAIEEKSQRVF